MNNKVCLHIRYFNTILGNKKKLNFISKKQSENYFTVKQQPIQIYITF